MNTSLAKQVELDSSALREVEPNSVSPPRPIARTSPQFPVFDTASYAATARIASRINAANISDVEYRALLSERQALLDKKLSGDISRRELNRLQYVRWTLDRVEDARHGRDLEVLESAVAAYERFQADVEDLYDHLSRQTRAQGGRKY